MSVSDAFSTSFYTLIKLCYTKALSDQASSLAPDPEATNPGGVHGSQKHPFQRTGVDP